MNLQLPVHRTPHIFFKGYLEVKLTIMRATTCSWYNCHKSSFNLPINYYCTVVDDCVNGTPLFSTKSTKSHLAHLFDVNNYYLLQRFKKIDL